MLEQGGEYLGITTNNQAEYQAVKLALTKAQDRGLKKLECYMDSMLVANQLNGIWKIKNRDLWPIYSDIKALADTFESISFQHVYREHNSAADAEVNKILDDHAS